MQIEAALLRKNSSWRTFAALAALALLTSCIEVGHRAEIGCLVDMTEPGCSLVVTDAATARSRDASAVLIDAQRSDAGATATDARSEDGESSLDGTDEPIDEAGPPDELSTDAPVD